LKNVPFVSTVVEIPRKKNRTSARSFSSIFLEGHFGNVEEENRFETLLTEGRYAQLFDYDWNDETLVRGDDEDTAEEDV